MPKRANHDCPHPKGRKWGAEEIESLRYALKHGDTLQTLADTHGISKQRVAQLVGAVRPMKEWTKTYSVYSGIDSWMKYHHVTYCAFNVRLGYSPGATSQTNLKRMLMGETEPRKALIDKVLEVTGMTYEEAFKRRSD